MEATMTSRWTAEEVGRLVGLGPSELVRGELRTVNPTKPRHGRIASRLNIRLGQFAEEHGLGETWIAEAGFRVEQEPDTIQAPDVAFVSTEHLPPDEALDDWFPTGPDMAVEVVAPTDVWIAVEEKVLEYLRAGSRLVWVVDPQTRTVHVYRPDGSAQILGCEETLTGEDVLPGFSVPVADLFA